MASHHNTFIKPFILLLLLLISTSSFSKTHPCLTEQQNALFQFKETIHYDPRMEDYYYYYYSYYGTRRTVSWPNDTDCCMWDGVTCDHITGDVISLDLNLAWLGGTINNSSPLFLLQNLQSLNLSFNHLSGSLSSFTQLPKLLHLDLHFNSFNGTIDSSSPLFLQNLQSLNLSENILSGSLDFFFFQLPNLVHLDLSSNYFNGSIPLDISYGTLKRTTNNSSSLFSLQNLQSLDLSGNRLSGSLDFFFFQLPNLVHLDLSSNYFHGSIPLDISHSTLNSTTTNSSSLFPLQNLQSLDLSGNYLSGSLFFFFFQFPKLVHLDLSYNGFNGSIPLDISYSTLNSTTTNSSSLFPLQNLQSLDLSGNYLSGSLVFFFFQFLKLVHLDLSSNNFNGSIPLDISYSTLNGTTDNRSSLFPSQNLRSLDLSYNDLSGSINFLGQFSSLMHLDLSFNEFSCIIPNEFAHLSQLISLNISGNKFAFTNSLLDSLTQNLPQIQELSLNYVRMDGDFPRSLPATLRSLTLSNCSLRGRFPAYVFHLPNLSILDASENLGLIGSLPKFDWSSPLISLDLSSTGFSGNIPNSIGNLKNLENLYLQSCHFTNLIPEFICSLSSLRVLDLSSNKFSGMIPQCLGNLTNLRLLDMSLNQLTGPLPQSLNNCTVLEHVNVSSNMLTDTFPFWLGHLPNLFAVDLGQNRFYGHLPNFDGNLSLEVLDLSSNNLEGPIRNLPQVFILLTLSNNKFMGKIPQSICNSRTDILDLSSNSLTGTIPPCLLNKTDNFFGSIVKLRMNKLEGAIPDIFTENTTMKALDLSGNQLTGPLPRSLVNCKRLVLLDLSNNNIEDSFPYWLETLPTLQVLVLHSNRFNGELKSMMDHSFPNLRVFDISNNNLTGLLSTEFLSKLHAMKNENNSENDPWYLEVYAVGIPNTIIFSSDFLKITLTMKGSRFEFPKISRAMTLIDFSNNNFQGDFPEVIGELVALKGLSLSHNNLTGSIPLSIQNLTNLEGLDLSSNKLDGQIPSGLTHLTELESLNLSYNELKGMIPRGPQLDTFGLESFVGNTGLCGLQVAKTCVPDILEQPQPPFPPTKEDDFNAFDWKIILMGYVCGLVIGISIGYIVFELRRPEWFVSLVEEELLKKIVESSIRRI